MQPALEAAPEERERQYEEAWDRGGLPFLGAFGDLLFEKAANDTIADFARRKIRGIVKDPATADLLCPENVFGCKRLCVDTGYFETYNLPHVKLVDVSKTPIERFTADGIEVDGVEYPLDAVVCATGFAAMTGSFDKISDHRPRRPDAGREMAGRSPRLSRDRLGGLSQSVHDHRSRQPFGAGQHDPGDRAACRLDGRLHGPPARYRGRHHRAGPAGRGRLGRARQRSIDGLAALDLQLLVCRHQHSRPSARVHALYRRLPGLCAKVQRGDERRLRRFCHRRRAGQQRRTARCA